MKKLIIITEIPSHYRLPVFNKIAKDKNFSLLVIYLKDNVRGRSWKIMWEENKFDFIILKSFYITRKDGSNKYISLGVSNILAKHDPDVIICDGYNHTASIEALIYSKRNNIRCLLRSESNVNDIRSNFFLLELIKKFLVRNFSGFISSGLFSRDYLQSLGAKYEDIWIAPDSVENHWYKKCKYKKKSNKIIKLLFVGRIMEHKGIFNLLRAFKSINEDIINDFKLTYIGDGDKINELKDNVKKLKLKNVELVDFIQPKKLAYEYSKHDIFIMPTLSDPWGLVVNEAMAAGLPIICSDRAGCSKDLVIDGWNGYIYEGSKIIDLKRCILEFHKNIDLIYKMGENSQKLIALYSSKNAASSIISASLNQKNLVEEEINSFRLKHIGVGYE